MATYVNDLRLKEISTGDESGTWGTSTNTNLELIGEALGYATEQSFGSDADATTTVADGASDPARAMYFKVTSAGNLTATRTLTIAPNTVSRVMFIENATSGSQSIAISQGSGANVTIATGKTAIVYLDGAGSGAAVVDAMAGVDPGVTDTLAEVLTAGNTTTTNQKIQFRDSAIYINSSADGQLDIVADTEVQIAATTVDINGNVDISGTVTAVGAVIQGTGSQALTVSSSTGNSVASFTSTDSQAYISYVDDSTTGVNYVATGAQGNDLVLLSGAGIRSKLFANGDFQLYEDTATTAKLFWDASTERLGLGTSAPYGALTVDTANGILNIANGNTSGGTKIQAWGATQSDGYLAIEGNTKEYMRIDASGNVGIGTSSPSSYLAEGSNLVIADSSHSGITLASGASSEGGIFFADGTSGSDRFRGVVRYNHASNYMEFRTDAGERMRINASGQVGIGTTSPDALMRVNGTAKIGEGAASNTAKLMVNTASGVAAGIQLFQDGTESWIIQNPASTTALTFSNSGTERLRIDGSGNVGIGENNPQYNLHIKGSGDTGIQLTKDGVVAGRVSAVTTGLSFGVDGANGTTERMRIDGSGNVGIGTSSGTAPLHILKAATGVNAATDVMKLSSVDTNPAYYVGFQTQRDNSAGMGLNILTTNVSGTVSESLRIDTAGNVGIGETNPAAYGKFVVTGTATQLALNASSGKTRVGFFENGTGRFFLDTFNGSDGLAFVDADGSSERMRIDSSGKVLIGTTGTSFNERLTVNSNSAPYSAHLFAGSGATAPLICRNANGVSGTRSQIIFYYDANARGSITSTSSATAYNTSSDQRLKENIADADDAGSKVDAIQVRKFDWIVDGSHQDYGMIAQELQSVAPEAVTGDAESDEMMAVDYSKLVPMLVKEIQTLRARVQQLEND